MGIEIEHKFLVLTDKLPARLPRGEKMEQGYLSIRPTVRVRIVTPPHGARQAWLTIKGDAVAGARPEYEYPLPLRDARELMQLCQKRTLTKIRYRLGGWELDEFTGRHQGLWLAEYELKSRGAKLPALPEWVGVEVTGESRYTNASLAMKS